MALDASTFVDTSAWANEMQPGGAPMPPRPRPPRPSMQPSRTSSLNNPQPDIESLEQMLEPDRTGVHKNDGKKTPWALIIVVLVLIAAGAAAVAMFVLKK
jgi:hypothetical protein